MLTTRGGGSGPIQLYGTCTLPAALIPGFGNVDLAANIVGANLEDQAVANPRTALDPGLWQRQTWISAVNTLTVRVTNATAGGITPAAPIVFDCFVQGKP